MKKAKKLESLKKMQLKSYNIKGGITIYDFETDLSGEDTAPTTRHLQTYNQIIGHYQCDHKGDNI